MTGCTRLDIPDVQVHYRPLRITGMQLQGQSDIELRMEVDTPMDFRIYAADSADDAGRVIAKLSPSLSGVLFWTDRNAVNKTPQRYYWIRNESRLGKPGPRVEWAMFAQPREAGQQYLVSVPVDLADENRLDGRLGEQLATGLHVGATPEQGDRLKVMGDDGEWQTFYLLRGADGDPQWWDPRRQRRATDTIAPGVAFWLERGDTIPANGTTGVFWGPCYTATRASVRMRGGQETVTPFGLPYSRPIHHRGVTAHGGLEPPPNQLGFANGGAGGSTSDRRRGTELGDHIWTWDQNEWQGRYWLMAGVGDAWDGRWWDDKHRDFADFTLQPGRGYYYLHRTNRWGGGSFIWQPPPPAARNRPE